MFKKEPALIIGAIIAILQALAVYFTSQPEVVTPEGVQGLSSAVVTAGPGWMTWVGPILTMLGSLFIRAKVFPEQTIRDAGISPAAVVAKAKDESVRPYVGE